MSFITAVWEGIKTTSIIEWLAVVSTIIYVILAAKRLILCWFFAFIGAAFFVYLCYIGDLYIESILQLFYVAMAVFGWFSWKKSEQENSNIKKWGLNNHLINILISGFVALALDIISTNIPIKHILMWMHLQPVIVCQQPLWWLEKY